MDIMYIIEIHSCETDKIIPLRKFKVSFDFDTEPRYSVTIVFLQIIRV